MVDAVGEDGRHDVDGEEAFDWEDIAIGRGPREGAAHLYIGDIGDNFEAPLRLENPARIYRLPEPELTAAGADGRSEPVVAFEVEYEDGPRDAETLMADPLTDDLLIVSKPWDDTPSGVYRFPAAVALADTAPDAPMILERVADVPGTPAGWLTGGDVSADGTLVVLRTYDEVWIWDRDPQRSVGETLANPPTCRREVVEPQGEAVAFSEDGRALVTVSEGEHQPVLWHRLPPP